ncbi:MAG: hypothetical protein J3Q66DRAFT_96426 [Benniella sp.]|nr:MAG: hypothetical protein J3Q66DRAFT_96426 [Benniella sp.]
MSTNSLTEIGWPGAAFTTRTRPELAIAAAAPSGRVLGEERDGAEPNVTYKVLYPKLHGMAATTRILLALGGVRWESIYPSEWGSAEKEKVPFGVMPVLYEIHHRGRQHSVNEGSGPNPESGSEATSELVLEIPESEAIERYLARKFGLLGHDAWEETAINAFYSSSNAVMSHYVNKVLLAFPDTKERELEKFATKQVPQWIAQHEKWLARNGSNGFYVGDKLSLADIRSVICLDRFMTIPECKDMFSPTLTPGLFMLKQNLESNPRYSAWMTSDDFEAITASTRQRLAVLSG